MINSDRNIFVQETEIKPNKYAMYVLSVTAIGVALCWVLNELGIFRVGALEMRVGSSLTLLAVMIPLIMLKVSSKWYADPRMKYIIIIAASFFTLEVTTFMTFHTTILLLFPIFIAMLYRSKEVGKIAVISSFLCTTFSPILGYMLNTWDIPLFQELILIATNGGVATIEGGTDGILLISILKTLLYICIPRLIMVGSCGVLLFYVVSLSTKHVENQILINKLSHNDVLTGVYNRNYYEEVLGLEKESERVSVIFFDVNNLKPINDKYGHEAGDLLLTRCAQSLKNVCNWENESVFRLGGDEFIFVTENGNEVDTISKLNEWRRSLKEINEENQQDFDGLVCSMAFGYVIGDILELDELVKQADALMYEMKATMKANMR